MTALSRRYTPVLHLAREELGIQRQVGVWINLLHVARGAVRAHLGEAAQLALVEAHGDNRVATALLALVHKTGDRVVASTVELGGVLVSTSSAWLRDGPYE